MCFGTLRTFIGRFSCVREILHLIHHGVYKIYGWILFYFFLFIGCLPNAGKHCMENMYGLSHKFILQVTSVMYVLNVTSWESILGSFCHVACQKGYTKSLEIDPTEDKCIHTSN